MAQFEVGDRAPDFSATTYDGNKIRLADFLGKRVLVQRFNTAGSRGYFDLPKRPKNSFAWPVAGIIRV